MDTKSMKKDFQKMVKAYRDSKPAIYSEWSKQMVRPEFPKAMLTNQQLCNNTATINFGYGASKQDEAKVFLNSAAFIAFCEKYEIKNAFVELNSDNRYQLRVNY